MKAIFPEKKHNKIILACVCALSVFLILFHFTDTPNVWLDEGIYTEIARNLALHGIQGLQIAPGNFVTMPALITSGYPLIFPVALSLRVFGIGLWQARLPMVLYMMALVVLFYLFNKKRYGFYPAILSVLLLVSFSPFYGNGRSVQGEIPGLVFLMLGSLILLYAEERQFDSGLMFLSGFTYGLAMADKPLYLIALVGALIITTPLWFKKVKDKRRLVVFAFGCIIPLIAWVIIQFPSMAALSSAIPTYLFLASNHGAGAPLIQTIASNFLRFFRESTPLLFLFLSIGIMFSAVYIFFKKKYSFNLAECIIAAFIVLNWSAYLLGTGWYRYFFPAHVLLYLFFSAGLLAVAENITHRYIKRILWLIPIVLIIFQLFDLTYLSDTSLVGEHMRNTALVTLLQNVPPTQTVFFDNTVEAIVFLKNVNYSQYLSMDTYFSAGDKNILFEHSADVIVTNANDPSVPATLVCYTKQLVSRYVVFQKIPSCKP